MASVVLPPAARAVWYEPEPASSRVWHWVHHLEMPFSTEVTLAG